MTTVITKTEDGDYVTFEDGRRLNQHGLPERRAAGLWLACEGPRAKAHSSVVIMLPIPEIMANVLTALAGQALTGQSDVELVPAQEMHITLAYFGDAESLSEEVIAELKTTIGAWAIEVYNQYMTPITGLIQGTGRFNDVGDEKSALFFTFSSADLAHCRQMLIENTGDASGHGFVPHITYAYVSRSAPTPTVLFPDLPVALTDVVFAVADAQYTWKIAPTEPEEKAPEPETTETTEPPEEMDAGFTIMKTADGRLRWVMYSSNGFEDRDRECVATAALEEDCDRADELAKTIGTKAYGPLRYCHLGGYAYDRPGDWTSIYATEGVDLGMCDWNAVVDGILVESGTFYDDSYGEVLAARAKTIRGSIRFDRPPTEPDHENVYNHIRRFERSVVPLGWAVPSNRFTAFTVQEASNGSYES